MNHDIAKGEFGIVSVRGLMVHQFSNHMKRNDSNQRELHLQGVTPSPDLKELDRADNHGSLTLEMKVMVNAIITKKNKQEEECAEILFFREPFVRDWIEELIGLFQQLPSEKRTVEARISYQDILDRKAENKALEPSNCTVMGESARTAFSNFMQDKPIKLTQDQLTLIAPQWCHIVMSSGVSSLIAQNRINLCSAPEGLNILMHVPEHMVAKLAEHLHAQNRSVHVKVKVQLFVGTAVLKSMKYKIKTDEVKISVNFEHPFRQPNFRFENQGVAHLEDLVGKKLKL